MKRYRYESWGKYPRSDPYSVQKVHWRSDPVDFGSPDHTYLPYGVGRSYGDSCLNNGGILLDTRSLRHFLLFDKTNGILRCEAGVTLSEILQIVVPHGWFLPVTPGTQYVTLGGAIANDVHGKNHHRAGTFGEYVLRFELLRSDGESFLCSQKDNSTLFNATIGGLGLTGLILWAEILLKPVAGPWVACERVRFASLEEFFSLSAKANQNSEYTVAWIDCFAKSSQLGRGSFIQGNHADHAHQKPADIVPKKSMRIPWNFPQFFLNHFALKTFNNFFFQFTPKTPSQTLEHFQKFFYPLDAILDWNRLYGSNGFLQYQCLIPPPYQEEGIRSLLKRIRKSGQGSFLSILKQFGPKRSPGIMSFPREGSTLALDFPCRGEKTFKLLSDLNDIVREFGGSVYPAKDARMSPENFQAFFPQWREFIKHTDPKFSSSFWRRVVELPSHPPPKEFDPMGTILVGAKN